MQETASTALNSSYISIYPGGGDVPSNDFTVVLYVRSILDERTRLLQYSFYLCVFVASLYFAASMARARFISRQPRPRSDNYLPLPIPATPQ